jgi:hypothetical protein
VREFLRKAWWALPPRFQAWADRVASYTGLLLRTAWAPTRTWLRDLRSEALLLVVGAILFLVLLLDRPGGATVHQLGPSLLWTALILVSAIGLVFLYNLSRAPARVYWAEQTAHEQSKLEASEALFFERTRAEKAEHEAELRLKESERTAEQLRLANTYLEQLGSQKAELERAQEDAAKHELVLEEAAALLHQGNELLVEIEAAPPGQFIFEDNHRWLARFREDADRWANNVEGFLRRVKPRLIPVFRSDAGMPPPPDRPAVLAGRTDWWIRWLKQRIAQLEKVIEQL